MTPNPKSGMRRTVPAAMPRVQPAARPANDNTLAARRLNGGEWHAIALHAGGHIITACGQQWPSAWMTRPGPNVVSCVLCQRAVTRGRHG